MTTISIVGMGPGSPDDLTLRAWKTLTRAQHLILRTERHPTVPALYEALNLGCKVESCDDLYEAHSAFEDVYAAIVSRVLAAAAAEDVVYAVPGHPWVGEATTPRLLAEAGERFPVEVVGGMGFVAPAFGAVAVDMMDGSQIADAMLLVRQHYPPVDVSQPLLIGQLYARWLASDVKLVLLNAYPAEHRVTLIRGAGTDQQALVSVPLAELDYEERFDHLTSLYVPPQAPYGSFVALQELVAHLRAPEGCPWDREQTLESLRGDLLDEACEVLEAIDAETDGSDNSGHIAEEIGDVLLVATMLTQIAAEEGRFLMSDVIRQVVTKLIRRHPHVFADFSVSGVDHVLSNWEAIKAQEKAEKGIDVAPLDGISAALPGLEKARKLQDLAAKHGMLDRRAVAFGEPELVRALGEAPNSDRVGEVIWRVVALASVHDINAEDALRSHIVRFRDSQRVGKNE